MPVRKPYRFKFACFFSDGSVCNGPVGYGACAAVLFQNVNNGDTQIVTKPIGKMVSSEKCEMEGVILGLEMSVEYFHCTVSSVTNQKLLVFCDYPTDVDKFQLLELHNYPGQVKSSLLNTRLQLKAELIHTETIEKCYA